jgi:sarcosine oxidase, subunit gamma
MQLNKNLEMTDLGMQAIVGLKGSNAAAWLLEQGIDIPDKANHWAKLGQDGMVLRLGMSEFLIQDANTTTIEKNLSIAMEAHAGVYHVPRADVSLQLKGDGVMSLLSQICRLNIDQVTQNNTVVMTQVAGVPAILLKASPQASIYRLWFDFSYQTYMTETITKLAKVNIDFEYV